MINTPQDIAPLILGTIYDPLFLSEFVNFHFWKTAYGVQDRLLNLPKEQKNVAIPLTPDSNPVIVQVALLKRAKDLLDIGFKVLVILRDLDEIAAQHAEVFSHLIKSFDSRIEIQSLSMVLAEYDAVKNSKSYLRKTMDNSFYYDLMNEWAILLTAVGVFKIPFLIAGQVEAMQIEETTKQLYNSKNQMLPTLLYLPELWLFHGQNISLNDMRKVTDYEKNITTKLLNATGFRFRSIHQYLLHVAVLASWITVDDQPSTILNLNVMDKTFDSSLVIQIRTLSKKIGELMTGFRQQEL